MNCSNCPGVEDIFNSAKADEEIRRYRELGPHRTTQMLVNALKDQGVEGLSLLDIGGGVGVLQNELLRIGVAKATSAEAVPIYADVAKEEAKQQGHLQRITYQFGDFVEIADQVPHADIVTLDSVLCCYPDMKSLVTLSVRHADKFYGIIFPRDTFLGRATVGYWNVSHWLKRTRFRSYTHATEQVSKLIGSLGMQLVSYQSTPVWQVVLYARTN